MNADPYVMKYFPYLMTKEQTMVMIERIKTHFEKNGFGLYAVDELATGQFIGFIGFSTATFESDFTPCTEIGWRLRKEAWNKGFATEGALACLEYGVPKFGLKDIYSFTAVLNKPSERVMQKIGMTKIGEFAHPRVSESSPLRPHVLYKISSSL